MKQHDSNYEFGNFSIEYAVNGYLVRRKDDRLMNRVEVHRTITELVIALVSHCGLLEKEDREIILKAYTDKDYVGGHK